MKKVTVRFFAVFRENAGVDSLPLESDAKNLKELFKEMSVMFPGLSFEAAALVAVNDVMASWEQGFQHGDEVLFFPPVAGG
jgi:molybdopterin converting factor small subunit